MANKTKKNKKTYHSFKDSEGNRHMQCKKCGDYRQVGEKTVAITCARCVAIYQMAKFPETLPKTWRYKPTGRPAGWHWMAEFVDKDGNVFHKGKEQPDLKGTLPPTKVTPVKRKKKKKLTEDEKMFKRAAEHKKKLKIKRKSNK